jgi:hypothetical protein
LSQQKASSPGTWVVSVDHVSLDYHKEKEPLLVLSDISLEGEKDALVKYMRYDILRKGQEIDRLNAKMDRILKLLGKGAKVDPKLLDVSTLEPK